jgi:predicted AlkP superfamily pyrophosphatase or phosphodiesterase
MREDYIESFGGHWKKGLRRLLDHGGRFTEAAYPYWNTVTCPGHATIGTGAFPKTHGMVLNAWWDRAKGKQVDCTDDPNASSVIAAGSARPPSESAANLRAATLADQMRGKLGSATRVVTLSVKPRSAITLAGQSGDAVIWFSGGGWTTSMFYSRKLPRFVERYQRDHPAEDALGKAWTKSLPDSAYQYADDAEGETPRPDDTRTFPHKISTLNHWVASPFSDAALGDLAQAAVRDLNLGKGQGTDFLAVSFSALDAVGHNYGPRSHEVQDVLAHLDETIGALLDFLDRAVGVENYVVAFTSDHGVAPIPEQMQAEGKDAGRIRVNDFVGVAEMLESYFGPGPHIQRILYTDLYFRPGIYEKLLAKPEAMQRVKDEFLKVPGVWRVYSAQDLMERKPDDPAARAAAVGYFPGRSGDLIILSRPYWFAATAAATHGTGHPYDARVPVILMGPMFQPGQYSAPACPADIAPTLASVLGFELAKTDGRVLEEAFRQNGSPPQEKGGALPRLRPGIFHIEGPDSRGFVLDFPQ